MALFQQSLKAVLWPLAQNPCSRQPPPDLSLCWFFPALNKISPVLTLLNLEFHVLYELLFFWFKRNPVPSPANGALSKSLLKAHPRAQQLPDPLYLTQVPLKLGLSSLTRGNWVHLMEQPINAHRCSADNQVLPVSLCWGTLPLKVSSRFCQLHVTCLQNDQD